ncbi:MAG: DUF5916 domain-containing protein [Gemmatimonadota bacterium]
MKQPLAFLLGVLSFLLAIVPWAEAQGPVAASADPGEPHAELKEGKVLRAFRIVGPAPQIDGRLDDDAWANAQAVDDFVQVDPENMVAPTERTMVQVAYDDRYLYVAIHAYDRTPGQIVAGLGRRDSSPPSDKLLLSLDPRHDHLTAYIFETNPSGVQADRVFFNDTQQNNDYSGVWEVETQITEEGWFAEYRIPFSQMQFDLPLGDEVVWGFTLRRDIFRRGEVVRWVGLPRGEIGFVSLFGHLFFEGALKPPRRIELQPFVFARSENAPEVASAGSIGGGVDGRLGLGGWGTLSATVNPDFGQVEQDPAVLNLSVFETFFPEKRAFFLEDSGTFRPPWNAFPLFHSRRIGQRPGRIPLEAGDQLLDRPEQTTILGAAKVAGKASSWTYGALTALTDREYATVNAVSVDGSGNETMTRTRRLIEPLTSYNVIRAQRDILGGTSNVGVIATAVVRDGDEDAFTGGVDYLLRWGRNRFSWGGHWVVTQAPFSDGQRTGFGGATTLNYNGRNLAVETYFDRFSPDFSNTDLGFRQGRVDRTVVEVAAALVQPDPWGPFRTARGGMGIGGAWSGDGLRLERSVRASANASFPNFWSVNVFANHQLRAFDDLDTRGGPPIVNLAETSFEAGMSTDSRKTWQLFVNAGGSRDEEGGWSAQLGPQLRLQPSARLQTSISASYRTAETVAQWITNRDVNGDEVIDHVYGRLDQNVIDVTARATYAFHRDLTVEAFLQPFVAVGDYTDIRRLAQPSSFEFEPATIPFDPDFNRKSLRANIVFRWEYLRGSTLFVVWNLSTLDEERPGEFAAFQDLGDAFGADGTHVFMAKATYWFGS